MGRFVLSAAITALALGAFQLPAQAQAESPRQTVGLWLPTASPTATVTQTVGSTNIELFYHRPAVNDRDIWGALVPYGQVWRTGANENTRITFSTDVTIEGQALAAGTYGLHTMPNEDTWQVIFSNDSTAWGSFSYDATEDALRVEAKPEATAHTELMLFTFDDVTNDSATLSLQWAELRLPIAIAVDTEAETLASIRRQLKGLSQFGYQGWAQAANWCLQNDVNLEEAVQWADSSISIEQRFGSLSTKSQLLAKLDDAEGAKAAMDTALSVANAGQLHNYGR